MDDLKTNFETKIKEADITVVALCKAVGYSPQAFYTALNKNKMQKTTYDSLMSHLDYLIHKKSILSNNDTVEKDLTQKQDKGSDNVFKNLITDLYSEIAQLKIENLLLKKELGKFDTVHLSLSELVSAVA
ncbi:hypothetical protein ACWA1C_09070 [Flectobacillus roseus]